MRGDNVTVISLIWPHNFPILLICSGCLPIHVINYIIIVMCQNHRHISMKKYEYEFREKTIIDPIFQEGEFFYYYYRKFFVHPTFTFLT